ncbi:MAG TPA: DUF1707 domain-containing protein [Streptosporangiaceae bacterium]|nr:DUF1707 domain-containing protein [Streptosporangiaceae bacterium]
MAELQNQTPAAAGGGHLRASHADREQVIDVLKAAFVQGMLAKDEFDLRVGQTLASRTYADLAAVTADIPAAVTAAQPPRALARAQAGLTMHRAVAWSACLMLAAALGVVVAWVAAVGTGNVSIFDSAAFAFIGATVASGTMIIEARDQQRSRGQLPARPAPGAGPVLRP